MLSKIIILKENKEDIWQKPLHSQKNPKKQHDHQNRHHKLQLHNDSGPT